MTSDDSRKALRTTEEFDQWMKSSTELPHYLGYMDMLKDREIDADACGEQPPRKELYLAQLVHLQNLIRDYNLYIAEYRGQTVNWGFCDQKSLRSRNFFIGPSILRDKYGSQVSIDIDGMMNLEPVAWTFEDQLTIPKMSTRNYALRTEGGITVMNLSELSPPPAAIAEDCVAWMTGLEEAGKQIARVLRGLLFGFDKEEPSFLSHLFEKAVPLRLATEEKFLTEKNELNFELYVREQHQWHFEDEAPWFKPKNRPPYPIKTLSVEILIQRKQNELLMTARLFVSPNVDGVTVVHLTPDLILSSEF